MKKIVKGVWPGRIACDGACEASDFMVGQGIVLDGGYTVM